MSAPFLISMQLSSFFGFLISVSYYLLVHLKLLDSWNLGPQLPSEHQLLCGVLCRTRKGSISFLQSFFLICAILILLSKDRYYLSTSPLAQGLSGVTLLWSIHSSFTNLRNSLHMNCCPLSVSDLLNNH